MNIGLELLSRFAPEVYEDGRQAIQDGKNVRVSQVQTEERSVRVKGLAEGNFGYHYNTNISVDFSTGEPVFRSTCGCYQRKNGLLCVHGAMLLIRALERSEWEPERISQPQEPESSVDIPEFGAEEPNQQAAPVQEEVLPDVSAEVLLPQENGLVDAQEAEVPQEEPEVQEPEEAVEPEEPFQARSMNILLGYESENGEPVYWHPNDTSAILNTNTGIIGTMGTGKTQITKALVTQLHRNSADNFDGKKIGILIFDYKGDYNENHPDFIRMTGAKIYRPYHFPLNPFDLALGTNNMPALPLHVASTFTSTIGKIYHLGDIQKQALLDCIRGAYVSQGIRPESPMTWTRRAPTFQMVYDQYDQNVLKKGDSLGSAMKRLHDFQIFEPNPLKTRSLEDLLDGVVVMDLSQYDPDIQNLIVAITLDLFYAQMKIQKSSKTDGRYRQMRKMILVDEADNFMSEDFPSLRKILKEGREFGVGTILSTQYLNHFMTGDDDYSSYIFTWIVHRVANLKGANVEYIFGVKGKTPQHEELYQSIKDLEKHCSVVKIGQQIESITDYPFWQLCRDSQ